MHNNKQFVEMKSILSYYKMVTNSNYGESDPIHSIEFELIPFSSAWETTRAIVVWEENSTTI